MSVYRVAHRKRHELNVIRTEPVIHEPEFALDRELCWKQHIRRSSWIDYPAERNPH